MKTVFQTYEGVIIYRSVFGTHHAALALKKAARKGYTSLTAVEPDGRTSDYTMLLKRDYLTSTTFKPAA